jgi:hypothetical protein
MSAIGDMAKAINKTVAKQKKDGLKPQGLRVLNARSPFANESLEADAIDVLVGTWEIKNKGVGNVNVSKLIAEGKRAAAFLRAAYHLKEMQQIGCNQSDGGAE